MIENIPHRLNQNFNQHPDYAMRLLEHLTIHSFMRHAQKMQCDFNVDLAFYLINSENNEKVNLNVQEIGASYLMFTPLIAVDVQKNFFELIHKNIDYPFGFYLQENMYSAFGAIPTLKNSKYFALIPHLIDYSIENIIKKGFTKSVHPLINVDSFLNFNDHSPLRKELHRIIADKEMKSVEIDLSQLSNKFFELKALAIQNREPILNIPNLSNRFHQIEPDVMTLAEHITYYTEEGRPLSLRLSNELDLKIYSRPQYSGHEMIKILEDEQKQKDALYKAGQYSLKDIQGLS